MSGSVRISVEDLTFSYNRHSPELFDHLTHEFQAAAVTALTGVSGRGKSTLLYVLGLMLKPSSGVVLLDGDPVSTYSDAQRSVIRAQSIGFVFQDSQLDPHRSIIDSVAEPGLYAGLALADARDKAHSLLQHFGLERFATSRPTSISGGQVQRAAVCRSLLMDPSVILADEPTGNLDRGNASAVLDSLTDAADHGCSVIIATHDPYVVQRSHTVVEL